MLDVVIQIEFLLWKRANTRKVNWCKSTCLSMNHNESQLYFVDFFIYDRNILLYTSDLQARSCVRSSAGAGV